MLAIIEKPEMLRHALPLGVAAYERMAELGLVDEKTELIRGVIFQKMSKSPLHSGLIQYLIELLQPGFAACPFHPDGAAFENPRFLPGT